MKGIAAMHSWKSPGPDTGRLRLAAAFGPAAVLLAIVTTVQPVMAESCVPTVAAFPPGHWVARGITVRSEISDDRSTTVVAGSGGFDLTVDATGAASGTFSLAGVGYSQSWIEGDDSSSAAGYIKTGEMSGTGTVVRIDGEMEVQIEGVIDVEPNQDGDQSNQSGQDLFGFGNTFTRPFFTQFSPSAAACNSVFGSLGGPVEYGTESDGSESYFMAFRAGAKATEVDVQGQLAELIEDAQFVLNMDVLDTDVLASFVLDMLQFESLLASLESCDPGDELELGAAWAMLQSVMFNTIRTVLDAADGGAYSTRDVITTIGIWLQGGSLGWRGADCLEINDANTGAMDLLVRFEDVLLERYIDARDANATAEMQQIAVAAYQYGLARVTAAVEGN
jgi:hypothetical protein